MRWARDAEEACAIVAEVAKSHGIDEVVKVKSMVTQEIGLNEALEAQGIAAWETDLAELIVQLGDDLPSHILVPAIHRNRAEIREIFRRRMDGCRGPHRRARRARRRGPRRTCGRSSCSARMAVSGANFAVAETGTLVVVESEGNGRMCLTLPEVLVSVVGIEKVVPTWEDLDVFLRLLPRSSTGERMNPYTSTWTGVTPGDGPQEVVVVLLDNGRTRALADQVGRQALRCIRCSACLNSARSTSASAGTPTARCTPARSARSSTRCSRASATTRRPTRCPYASSLCGACFEVCPVRIDIPSVLVDLRAQVVDAHRGGVPSVQTVAMKGAAAAFGSGRRLGLAERFARLGTGVAARFGASAWTNARDLPRAPRESFRAWWRRTDGGRS